MRHYVGLFVLVQFAACGHLQDSFGLWMRPHLLGAKVGDAAGSNDKADCNDLCGVISPAVNQLKRRPAKKMDGSAIDIREAPWVVKIKVESDCAGKSYGTGFIVAEDVIVTAAHVVVFNRDNHSLPCSAGGDSRFYEVPTSSISVVVGIDSEMEKTISVSEIYGKRRYLRKQSPGSDFVLLKSNSGGPIEEFVDGVYYVHGISALGPSREYMKANPEYQKPNGDVVYTVMSANCELLEMFTYEACVDVGKAPKCE